MGAGGNDFDGRRSILLEHSLCHFDCLFRGKGLAQVFIGLFPYRAQQTLRRAVRGHDHDFRVRRARSNPGKHLKASQFGHPDVEECQIKTSLLDVAQRLRAILHRSNRITGFLQHAGDGKAG